MKTPAILFQWSPGFSAQAFRAGISLHSHTLYSREPLDLVYRASRSTKIMGLAGGIGPIGVAMRQAERGC